MTAQPQVLDQALAKVGRLLQLDVTPPPPLDPSDVGKERLDRHQQVAEQHLYLRGMPIIDPVLANEIELSPQEIIRILKQIPRRPSLRRQILQQARAIGPQILAAAESTKGQDRIAALGEMIASDIADEGERIAPALALALVMAGYHLVKYWGR